MIGARTLSFIRLTMLSGAIYDLLFGLPILAAPSWLSAIIGVPMPQQEIYLRFLGVFLLGLAGFYMLPFLFPGRYLGNVVAAAFLRASGGIFMIAAVLFYHQPRVFLLLGAGDLAFAAVHWLSLVPIAGPAIWRAAGEDGPGRGHSREGG